jgi:hypothetical protein
MMDAPNERLRREERKGRGEWMMMTLYSSPWNMGVFFAFLLKSRQSS